MKNKIEEFLEKISKPNVENIPFENAFKLALLNSRRSSWIGVLFVIIPILILILALIRSLFHFNFGIIGNFTSCLSLPTRAILFFVLDVGFPMIAVALNILSITFFSYDSKRKELNMSFKLRWWNIVIILIDGAVAAFFLFHLVADTLIIGK